MSTDSPESTPEPLLWLLGQKAALGPFRRELVEKYWEWEQDPRVIIGYGRQTPDSLESRLEGYASQARSMGNQESFTVYDLTADGGPRSMGTTALRIDHYVRTAEYVILLGVEGRGPGSGGRSHPPHSRLRLPHHPTACGLTGGAGALHRRNPRLRDRWIQVRSAGSVAPGFP